MTTSPPSHESPLRSLTAIPLLEAMLRAEPRVVVLDATGRVAWMSRSVAGSREQAERCIGRLWTEFIADPLAAARLRARFEEQNGLWTERVEVRTPSGILRRVEVTAARLRCAKRGRSVVALVRPEGDSPSLADDLGRSLELLSAVLESSPEPVLVLDPTLRIKFANEAFGNLLERPASELLGRPLTELLSEEHASESLRTALAEGRRVERRDLRLSSAAGSTLWVSISLGPLRLADGTLLGAVAFVRDETVRCRVERELRAKNAELEQTLRALAHDLRSPLVSVLGFSRLLRDDFSSALGEKGSHYLRRIEEAGRTMEALIRELLEFARIGASGESLGEVDPLGVLRQLAAELKPRLESRGVRLEIPDAPPPLYCNRTRLYQILSNLVTNALEHMGDPPDPVIRVEIVEEGQRHRITVRDNGRGIAPEDHERIFRLFERGGAGGGSGLGLAIVRRLAEHYGGRAWVESEPGRGASFHVTLARRTPRA